MEQLMKDWATHEGRGNSGRTEQLMKHWAIHEGATIFLIY
jgi:hypothetical protein